MRVHKLEAARLPRMHFQLDLILDSICFSFKTLKNLKLKNNKKIIEKQIRTKQKVILTRRNSVINVSDSKPDVPTSAHGL